MNVLHSHLRLTLFAVFAVTGFSALTLQVVWQRVISLHSGVDLTSFTTVVAAFLAGIGIGSLLGGALADRLGPRGSLLAFAGSNALIAIFAWVSVALFYDAYRELASDLDSTAATFGFNFSLVVIPATLMGLSLPLVARGVVERIDEAGELVGRLYAVNTIGAAAGAAVSGWFLSGTFGFTMTLRVAGTSSLVAAVLVLSLWRLAGRVEAPSDASPAAAGASASVPPESVPPEPGDPTSSAPDGATHRRVWPWFALYALTGAVALGFELVFFRLIDSIMRSNSYSFPHVLMLYLLLFGIGAAVAARLVGRRGRDSARWFLGLQCAAGLAAVFGILLLTVLAPRLGFEGTLRSYFGGDNFNTGFDQLHGLTEWAKLVFAYLMAPLAIMAVPVFLFGASFPFVQALVSERVDTLGRRTGALLASNIAGNVVGTLLVGFVLLDKLGTSRTTLLLGGLLVIPGIAASLTAPEPRRRVALVGGVVAIFAVGAVLFPSNDELWAFVHGVDAGKSFELVEDRSCVTALKQGERPDGADIYLFVNGSGQNGYPWDDFHVLVGLTPALMHPDPTKGLAVGIGMGGTAYAMVQDDRLGSVEAIDICGGEIELLARMADEGVPELRRMFAEPRLTLSVGDGRKELLLEDPDLDIITVDVLRPTAAFSGSILSKEFYELAQSRLADGGLMAQWIATPRSQNSMATTFPYALGFRVPSYFGSAFFVASSSPVTFDRAEVLRRFDEHVAGHAFREDQLRSLRTFYETVEPFCLVDGEPTPLDVEVEVNHDLSPRDEYFLNNTVAVPAVQRCG